MRIDLHTHSRVSDGTDSPAGLVASAQAARLDVIALCDHDTQAGVVEAQAAGRELGVTVVAGLELSAQRDGVTVHLLGLGARTEDGALSAEMARIQDDRDIRIAATLARLADLGMPLTRAQVEAAAPTAATLGRPHIADALVAAGYAGDRTEVFHRWLWDGGPAYVPHYRVAIERGIALVQGAGGVAILAHPWGRSSRAVLDAGTLTGLAHAGLDGIEVHHREHDEAAQAGLARLAADLRLIQTGGSDYHGTGKIDHDLGCNTTDEDNWGRVRALILARGGASPVGGTARAGG